MDNFANKVVDTFAKRQHFILFFCSKYEFLPIEVNILFSYSASLYVIIALIRRLKIYMLIKSIHDQQLSWSTWMSVSDHPIRVPEQINHFYASRDVCSCRSFDNLNLSTWIDYGCSWLYWQVICIWLYTLCCTWSWFILVKIFQLIF